MKEVQFNNENPLIRRVKKFTAQESMETLWKSMFLTKIYQRMKPVQKSHK